MNAFIPNPLLDKLLLHEIEPTMEQLAAEGLKIAQRLVPVETGTLRGSLGIEGAPDGGMRVTAGAGGIYYWLFQEYGTKNMDANPFLRPIIDELGLQRGRVKVASKRTR